MHKTLHERYKVKTKERYLVQTQSQTKLCRIKLPEVHGVKKALDMNLLSEKQKTILQTVNNVNKNNKPRLGQGRAGIRHNKSQPTKDITSVMKYLKYQ